MIERSVLVYSEGYKYQLKELFCISTNLRPEKRVQIPRYVLLDTDGDLYISEGYCWDGPSGPTFDFKCDMAASLVHDALCQLITDGSLSKELKPEADEMLKNVMIEDGAAVWRAIIYEKAVNEFGELYLKTKKKISIQPPIIFLKENYLS